MSKNKKMTKEQCDLVTSDEVKRCVESIARRFGNKYKSVGMQEFYAEAMKAACEASMRYDPSKYEAKFLTFMMLYVIGDLVFYVYKFVFNGFIENKRWVFPDVVMIEELGLQRDDDDDISADDRLFALSIHCDEEERLEAIAERMEAATECITAEEHELLLVRFGFYDNHGLAINRYLVEHKMSLPTLYRKANLIVTKIVKSLNIR